MKWMFLGILIVVLQSSLGFAALTPDDKMSGLGYAPLKDYTPVGQVHEMKHLPADNQEQSEECFLFAYVNYLQVANINIYGRDAGPKISGPYLFTVKMLEYIQQSLQQSNQTLSLEGGNVEDAMQLSVTYGLVPEEAWQPKTQYARWPFDQLYKNIQSAINQHLKEIAKLTAGSREQEQAVRDAITDVQSQVLHYSGELPEQFEWQGKSWTPKKFAEEFGTGQIHQADFYLPQGQAPMMPASDLRQMMSGILQSSHANFSIYNESWDDLEVKMTKAIDAGIPVLVAVGWGRNDGHVMTAVGYEMRANGVFAWKFLNSWGRWGEGGEAFFKDSDVRAKADQVWILQ